MPVQERTAQSKQARLVADNIAGYDYGSPNIAKSPIDLHELGLLKESAGFTEEDQRWLHTAGEILAGETKELVGKWRAVIAKHPHLARYSLRPDGQKDASYSERSGLRFEQWVLDTCFRPYDQDWLNYQQETALRHTSVKKNKTDSVDSAPTIHLRHLIAFGGVMTDPEILKPFLGKKGHPAEEIEKMHRAWSKSLWLQLALWSEPYTDPRLAPDEW
jgi:hypothetical protein